jgi:integrase/recombinase XerD
MQGVSLYIRIADASGRRKYVKAKVPTPSKPKPQQGVYYLRYEIQEQRGDGSIMPRRVWEAVGNDYGPANAALHLKHAALWKQGKVPFMSVAASEGTLLLANAIEKYLANITALKSESTAAGYSYALNQFKVSCKKIRLKDIRKQDLTDFIICLKQQGLSDRTISNRVGEVVTFLRANEIKDITVRHKYVEKKVKAYHSDDLKLLMCAAKPEEWIAFQFFLGTGCRDQEVMHATWDDVDFKDGIFTVREHPEFGFKPKDYEEREIPLPTYLLEALKQRTRTSKLIFPTRKGKPQGHFLRMLKEVAERAGVDPDECGLHKFRKTYATLQHENGVSARTIQKRLGHSSLETTLAYLEAADVRSAETRKAVDDTFAVFA